MTRDEIAKGLHAIDVVRHGLLTWEKLTCEAREAYEAQARWVLEQVEVEPIEIKIRVAR